MAEHLKAVAEWMGLHTGSEMAARSAGAVGAPMAFSGSGSGPVFGLAGIGGSAVDAALGADREVSRLLKQPGATDSGTAANQALVEAFTLSPLTGITTITSLALRKANWGPKHPTAAGARQSALEYGNQVNRAPFFSLVTAASTISSTGDGDAVSLARLLGDALSLFITGSPMFVRNAISVNKDYQLSLMVYTPSTSNANNIVAQQTVYALNLTTWPNFASQIARAGITCVDEWIALMVTPKQV